MSKKKDNDKRSLLVTWIIIIIICLAAIATWIYQRYLSPTVFQPSTHEMATTYVGMFPCADCSGLQTELILFQNKTTLQPTTFILTQTYLGKNIAPFVSKGTWKEIHGTAENSNATVYQLNPEKQNETENFLKVNSDTIQMLDQNLHTIQSSFPLRLSRQTVSLANPASVHCAQNGGALEIQKDAKGNEYGMCIFSNGKSCEEWTLFRDNICTPYAI